jgi:hypothetical protein
MATNDIALRSTCASAVTASPRPRPTLSKRWGIVQRYKDKGFSQRARPAACFGRHSQKLLPKASWIYPESAPKESVVERMRPDSTQWPTMTHHFGVLAPSTNTMVEVEYGRLLPPSLQVHVARIPRLSSGIEGTPRGGDAVRGARAGHSKWRTEHSLESRLPPKQRSRLELSSYERFRNKSASRVRSLKPT